MTLPFLFILVFMVGTFCPLIYSYLPFLGNIRIVFFSIIASMVTYLFARHRYNNFNAFHNPIYISWIFFFFAMIFSIPFSMDKGLSVKILNGNLLILLMMSIMIKIVDNSRRLVLLINTLCLCVVVMAGSAVFNYIFNKEMLLAYRTRSLTLGLFADPNDLATLLNAFSPLLLYHIFHEKRKTFVACAGIFLTIFAIILTYSRAGFLSILTTMIGVFCLIRPNKVRYWLGGFGVVVFFILVVPDNYVQRLSTIFIGSENGQLADDRHVAWVVGIKKGLENPFVGVGVGCSFYLFGSLMDQWLSVHNSFIQVFLENGIFGLIPYCLLFIFPIMQYRKLKRSNFPKDALFLQKILLISCATYGVSIFFTPQAYSPILFVLTGLNIIIWEIHIKFT